MYFAYFAVVRRPLQPLDFPPFSIFGLDKRVGFLVVGELQILGVPLQLLIGEPNRDVAEQYGLGQRSREIERSP